MSTVLIQLTEEERDAVIHVLGYGIYQARRDKVTLPVQVRDAVAKLRDAEPVKEVK